MGYLFPDPIGHPMGRRMGSYINISLVRSLLGRVSPHENSHGNSHGKSHGKYHGKFHGKSRWKPPWSYRCFPLESAWERPMGGDKSPEPHGRSEVPWGDRPLISQQEFHETSLWMAHSTVRDCTFWLTILEPAELLEHLPVVMILYLQWFMCFRARVAHANIGRRRNGLLP